MMVLSRKLCVWFHAFFVFILVSLLLDISGAFTQVVNDGQLIFFISDFQAPMRIEKILFSHYRNEDARDTLFADIMQQRPGNIFLLGDMALKGSKDIAWTPLDNFMSELKKRGTPVYAIPGNHEYIGPTSGMQRFRKRFNEEWLHGYMVTIDSISMVMLNSNFVHMGEKEAKKQLAWYSSVMDYLDNAPAVKAVVVCIHHAPYSNSRVVGSSIPVQELIVPVFEKSKKSRLFISGHSHNLEYFTDGGGKYFLVIGGGGGIDQPLISEDRRIYKDLLAQESKPRYFYLVMERVGNELKLTAKGFKRDFNFFEFGIV